MRKGVYCWRNKKTNEVEYIGSTGDLNRRESYYQSSLTGGYCGIKALQKVYYTDGAYYEVLEEFEDIEPKELVDLENMYMYLLEPKLNQRKAVVKSKVKDTSKMSKAQSGTSNHACQTDVSTIVAIKTDILRGLSNKEIAEKYDKTSSYVSMIRTEKRWASIKVKNEKEIVTVNIQPHIINAVSANTTLSI
ncbi:MAG: GIY-YIG nuclease family protein [Vallitalea sp.]|jgi:hypothetical protein|nr:GIY-YIG nuclease family protein [Vallitalea sp.]